jgi:hypothetical protein
MPAIFALAFRQDGFGTVLSQALGSGLSVVRTKRTGGPDLAGLPGLARLIWVVPTGDALALRSALTQALGNAMEKIGVRDRRGSEVVVSCRAELSRRSGHLTL